MNPIRRRRNSYRPAHWRLIVAFGAIVSLAVHPLHARDSDPVGAVDPFIGVDGGGNVFPGAVLPFGEVSLSPDTAYPQSTSGYSSGKPVIGFSCPPRPSTPTPVGRTGMWTASEKS